MARIVTDQRSVIRTAQLYNCMTDRTSAIAHLDPSAHGRSPYHGTQTAYFPIAFTNPTPPKYKVRTAPANKLWVRGSVEGVKIAPKMAAPSTT